MNKTTDSHCPKCGAPIPGDAPQGLCPKCVLAGAATVQSATTTPGGRTPPPTVEEIAPHFPDLEVVELIGAGGMGAVYKVRQPNLERFVALKLLSHDLSADPAFAERFNREARVLAKLNHPNIVTVFDFGTAGPFCYLLMEFVDGVNLRQAMHAGRFTPADTLALVQDVCGALKFAHEEGILHRDIKPENVLIDSRGRVKIADFGIAKLVGEESKDHYTLTMQGAVLGSPQYMAPEQIETPGDVDQRADIYSLGVVFYELLTGELPIGRFALPSEKASLDARIDEIVMRTLEKERDARFQSAGEVQTQVEAVSHAPAEAAAPRGDNRASSNPNVDDPVPETARFATVSAILTAVSLLLAVITMVSAPIVAMNVTAPTTVRHPATNWVLPAMVLAALLAVGIPAFLGTMFGAFALADLRRSGGRKEGFGRAMFGTLTWPVLIIVGMTAAVVSNSLYVTAGGGGLRPGPLSYVVLGVGTISLVLVVRTIWCWARGGTRGGEAGRSSGWVFAGKAVALIVIAILGLQWALRTSPPAQEVGESPDLDPSHNPESISSRGGGISRNTSSANRDDRVGLKSKLDLDFTAPAGHVTIVELLSAKQTEASWYVVSPDEGSFEGYFSVGTIEPTDGSEQPGTKLWTSLKGTRGQGLQSKLITLEGAYEVGSPQDYPIFEMDEVPLGEVTGAEVQQMPRPLDFSRPGVHLLNIADRTDRKLLEGLQLVAWSVPRPVSARTRVPRAGRIGAATPPDALDAWIEEGRNARRSAADNAQLSGEQILSLDKPKGDLRLRSGMLFKFREHRIAGKVDVHKGQGLAMLEGSEVSVSVNPSTQVQLGPQTDVAELGFLGPAWWHLQHGTLRVNFEKSPDSPALEISTVLGTVRTNGATFQLTSAAHLQVFEGEVEALGHDGEKIRIKLVKAGEQFTFPSPENPGRTDPAVDRGIEQYLEATKRLNALLAGVTDSETARKVAPDALAWAERWVALDHVLVDASDPAAAPSMLKYGAKLKKQMAAFERTWEKLFEDPTVIGPLEETIRKIEPILARPQAAPVAPNRIAEPTLPLERE